MRVSLLVAVAENGVIGRANTLPWHLSDDLKLFKRLTTGHPIVMGRKTWDSIGRPLPKRRNIVITRDPAAFRLALGDAPCPDDVVDSLPAALALLPLQTPEVFIVGGGQIYATALPFADRLYWTRVHGEVSGDTYFPEVDWSAWHLVDSQPHPADERNDHAFTACVYDRAR